MTFAEEQGSFLVGAAAAMKCKTGKIGFIGGVENDLIKKFEAGYTAGAKQVNPDITVDVKYISQPPDFTGFNDPAKGKEIAAAMYEDGADVVYAAAGGSGLGMFQAAKEYTDAQRHARVGHRRRLRPVPDGRCRSPAVHPDLDARSGSTSPCTTRSATTSRRRRRSGTSQRSTCNVDGVGYSTTGGNLEDIMPQLDDLKQQIIDGKITVPDRSVESTSQM